MWRAAPPEAIRFWFNPWPPVGTMARAFRRLPTLPNSRPVQLAGSVGVVDALTIQAMDPSGRGVAVSLSSSKTVKPAPHTIRWLTLLSAHLGTAARLRHASNLSDVSSASESAAEAVLDPSGRVCHAEGLARGLAARTSLAEAVIRTFRARGKLRRTSPDEALDLWKGLVEGRWSLVDSVEADGRRYVLARQNPPKVRDPKSLSPRERAVLAYAVQGHANKYIAYVLGVATTTIATHLACALRKLGLRSRREAIQLFSGARAGPKASTK